MKQPKFNPHKDMKELEKYGFIYKKSNEYEINELDIFYDYWHWYMKDEHGSASIEVWNDGSVYRSYAYYGEDVNNELENMWLKVQDDLIKANLLIVEDTDEQM